MQNCLPCMRNLAAFTCFILVLSLGFPGIGYADDEPKTTEQLNYELMQQCKEFTDEDKIADLLSAGAEAQYQDRNGHTPLHFLVGFFRSPKEGESVGNYIEVAKLLIEAGSSIDAVDYEGVTALVMATRIKHFEMANFLVEAGADPTIIPADGRSVLQHAAQATETDLCRKLIAAGANPCLVDEDGVTPLMMIASGGHFTTDKQACETLELLLEYDQESLLDTDNLEKLINRAAAFGAVEFAKILISHGAKVDVPSSSGFLPIHWAARNKKTEIIPLLTTDKAQPDIWVAYYLDDKELFHKLIAEGADVDQLYDLGRTMLNHAAWGGKSDWAKLFLEAGANINAAGQDGNTALYISCATEKEEVVKILLAKGADPNIASDKLLTPLHIAAINDFDQIIAMLLNAGAKPNVFNDEGDTPLHWAAKHHCDASVKQLILGGADLNVRNDEGKTPFYLACIYPPHPQNLSTSKLLLRWSANPCIPNNDGNLPWYVYRLFKEEDYQYFGENEAEIKEAIAKSNERLMPIIAVAGCCR